MLTDDDAIKDLERRVRGKWRRWGEAHKNGATACDKFNGARQRHSRIRRP
jgi:hypothetical protein